MNKVKNKANTTNLHTKIKKIQAEITPLIRTEKNTHQNYKFFNELQILKALKPLLEKYNLALYLSDDTTQPFIHEREGNMHFIKYCKKLEIVDCETESKLEFSDWACGQNPDLAKAKGAAETYAIKYLLSKFFLIKVLDENDPDLPVEDPLPESTENKVNKIEPTQTEKSKTSSKTLSVKKEFSPRITATIHKLKDKTDKNGNKYLLLGLDDQTNNVFVFPYLVPEEEWVNLKVGQTYNFDLEKNEKGMLALNKFEKADDYE